MSKEQPEPTVWGIGDSEDTEHWGGGWGTREVAIEEGKKIYGEPFWVTGGVYVDVTVCFKGHLEDIIDMASDRADEFVPTDDHDDALHVGAGAAVALDALLVEWARKYVRAGVWTATGPKERIEWTRPEPP